MCCLEIEQNQCFRDSYRVRQFVNKRIAAVNPWVISVKPNRPQKSLAVGYDKKVLNKLFLFKQVFYQGSRNKSFIAKTKIKIQRLICYLSVHRFGYKKFKSTQFLDEFFIGENKKMGYGLENNQLLFEAGFDFN